MDDGSKAFRVIQLCVENFKRIRAADVSPGRNAVLVKGKNKSGKTSLLDAIAAALGGKKAIDPQPVRTGTDSSAILCVLGDTKPELIVKRVFTSDGKTALEITTADGYVAPSPQAILDGLCGAVAFDPLAFTRMGRAEQLKAVQELIGLDFTDADQERQSLYTSRTSENRLAKAVASQAGGVHVPDDTPDEAVSIGALLDEARKQREHNQQNANKRRAIGDIVEDILRKKEALANAATRGGILTTQLAAVRTEIADAQRVLNVSQNEYEEQRAAIAGLEDFDTDALDIEITQAQVVNGHVAAKCQRRALEAQAEAHRKASSDLTERMDVIDADKLAKIKAAPWPVGGMSLGPDCVLYNDLPFCQASGAEQTAVSFAMVAALNPRIKVALIRDASLLDDEQMEVVQKLAEKHDMQVWLEVVDAEAGPCGILIEDGTIAEAPPKPEPPKIDIIREDETEVKV